MTEQEKRKLALARELQELEQITRNFAAIAKQAADETLALNQSFARLNKLARDAELDRLIDEADYHAGRGAYAHLRGYRDELRRLGLEARQPQTVIKFKRPL